MSYTPINWQTGDTITAEKLNKMDNEWSVSSGESTLCEESVTTEWDGDYYFGTLTYSTAITASTITVTFDNVEYTCPAIEESGTYFYGDEEYSLYPFLIESYNNENVVYTETAGTHSIKIEAVVTTTETSSDFQTAVKSVSGMGTFIATERLTTWQQIYDAMTANKIVCVRDVEEDSVSLYPVVTARLTPNGTYEVIATYADGGQAAIRYYNAASANSPIYGA